jgi:hypothetical protein
VPCAGRQPWLLNELADIGEPLRLAVRHGNRGGRIEKPPSRMYAPRIFGSSPVNDSRESAMQSILPAFIKSTAAATLATSTWVAFGEALLEARKVAVPAPAMRTPAALAGTNSTGTPSFWASALPRSMATPRYRPLASLITQSAEGGGDITKLSPNTFIRSLRP